MNDPIHPASHDLAGPPPATPERPSLRASDAEREHVADVLRRAAGDGRIDVDELDERLQIAYSTRTKAELDRLTADVVATPASAPAGVQVPPGDGGTRGVISIMGGTDRGGRWRIAPGCFVFNLMGGSDLDLNQAELSDQVTTITALSIMGGMNVRQGRRLSRAEKRRQRELRRAQERSELDP